MVVNDAINYVRRGGSLLVYSLYDLDVRVQWSPLYLLANEIKVRLQFILTIYLF